MIQITIRVKPEVGWNGPSLCGIESLYNGLSKTTKILDIWSKINEIRVFENDKHFEFLKKKKRTPTFQSGSGRVGPDSVRDGPDYNVHTIHFLKHAKILVYDAKKL